MNYKTEISKVFDECIDELVNEFGEITESEKLDLELLKEAFTYQLFKEVISEKDEKFVLDNLDLYKKLIKSVFKEDENEIKKCLIELLRAKNESH